MGTRADFYVGRGKDAEWLGSIAWDGYPEGIDAAVFDATTEAEYRDAVQAFFAHREDVSTPAMGWPWPWETSHTTDYAYAWASTVHVSSFGGAWFSAKAYLALLERDDSDEKADAIAEMTDGAKLPDDAFPTFTFKRGEGAPLGSKRSGVILVTVKR